jgi:peptidoglycan/xylan/chitin deacetylase (PgdA/CDA1 family)
MLASEYPHVTRSTHRTVDGRRVFGRPSWPNDARCVVALTIDFDGPSFEVGIGHDAVGTHSSGRYSGRCGVPRYLNLLEEEGVKATFFVPGYDAECYPEVVREIAQRHHEVAAHGYLHEMLLLPQAEEERRLNLTHDILTDVIGRAPVGWRSPGGLKTPNTLGVLHKLGYQYDCSDKDADMPYTIRLADGRSLVELPNNTFSLDDFPFYSHSRTPVSEVLQQWMDEFDSIYSERGYYLLTVHPRSSWGSGTANRANAVRTLIRYIKRHRDVVFVTLPELATWVSNHSEQFDEVRA